MKTAALGAIAEIVSGATPKTGVAEYWDGDVEWATPADLSKLDGAYISTTPRKITQAGVRSCATTILPEGSVLLSSRAPIGHVAINTVPMATNQGFKSLVPGPELDAKFLFHWLKSKADYLQSLGNGATFKELSKKSAEQIQVPLPPLPEQRRIAAILDHADALRTKRCQVLAHVDSLTQAIFNEMFGDARATEPLSAVVEEFRYGTSNKSGDRGYPALRIPNVIGGALDTGEIKTVEVEPAELKRLMLRDGDLLFVRTNGNPDNVGRSAIFSEAAVKPAGFGDQPWIYASYLIRARLRDGVEPRYVAAYLASPAGRRQLREGSKTSAGQYNINTAALGSVRLPPASPAAQREFVRLVSVIEERRKQILVAQAADSELFASLQSRAFRGEL